MQQDDTKEIEKELYQEIVRIIGLCEPKFWGKSDRDSIKRAIKKICNKIIQK